MGIGVKRVRRVVVLFAPRSRSHLGIMVSWRHKRTTFCTELTSHSPPPTPLLPALPLSAGERQVSGGEFKVSRPGGAASHSTRSCRVATVEPPVSYLETGLSPWLGAPITSSQT